MLTQSSSENHSRHLSIQFVSKVTGINPHTIRAWEKRYQCLSPGRDHNGRRLYTDSDVEKLQLLFDLVNHGNNISEIANLKMDELKGMHHRYVGQSSAPAVVVENTPPALDINSSLQNLILALHSYRLDVISHELEKIRNNISPREFALSLLAPLMRELGEHVANQYINVAQEHALSSILRFHLGQILAEFVRSTPKTAPQTMIIATPEGERHEFGILIAALLCCHYKIKFLFLGVDLPAEALADAAKQIKPDYILLGISKGILETSQAHLRDYINKLRHLTDKRVKMIIGGASAQTGKAPLENVEWISTLQLLDARLNKI